MFAVKRSATGVLTMFFRLLMFFVLLNPAAIFANINYHGVCGQLSYELNISSSRFTGGMCVDDRVLVYDDSSTDYVRFLYCDPQMFDTCDIMNYQTGATIANFNHAKKVKYAPDDYVQLLYGLAGIFAGYVFFVAFGRVV